MIVTLYEDETVFADLHEEWHDLLVDSPADQIFLTHEWLSTWWEAYRPGRIWTLVVRDETGQCQGIAPWFLTTGADGQRTVHPIGCEDVTDYVDVIVRQGRVDAVFEVLAAWIAEHTELFDVMRLCNFPQDSLALAQLPDLLEARGLVTHRKVEDVCPVLLLPETFQDYLGGLDKKNRHELRRKLRRVSGQVDWYVVGGEHDLEAEIGKFLALMAASSSDKALFLENVQNEQFFKLIVPRMAEHGWLQLAFLTVEGDAAAAYLNFDYNNRIMVYNSGHNPDMYRHLSPGIVLLARLIEHAIGCRRNIFDFLRGDEVYKYDMGGKETRVYRLEIRHNQGQG